MFDFGDGFGKLLVHFIDEKKNLHISVKSVDKYP